jgi:hypothetical protein
MSNASQLTSGPHHGSVPRGLESVPRSVSYDGRFGRMFRHLAPFEPSDDDLTLLAATMIEPEDENGEPVDVEGPKAPSNNEDVPAGFTYLGQFIDHDLTFDPTSKLQRENDPNGLRNFRTPRFDLDSLYGRGPDDGPFLYQDGVKFLIGHNATGEKDLPRNAAGRALIGDPRNDENMIVSQLHLAFLQYHNRIVDDLGMSPSTFERARQMVRWHYQWIVLKDFLPKIVGQQVIDEVLEKKTYSDGTHACLWKTHLQFFAWHVQPFMPVEFSVAAYRFGHSMVRANYALNNATEEPNEVPIFDPHDKDNDNAKDLRGFRARPPHRQIEWFRFFDFPERPTKEHLQVARAFDTQLVHGLGGLPTKVATKPSSLAARNLLRGKALGLPSGQAVARAMGIPECLTIGAGKPFQIGTGYTFKGKPDPSVPQVDKKEKEHLEAVFGQQTPLWYYILKEAELLQQGKILGPVGGRIVAEVFIGLLWGDPLSFINVWPGWQPHQGDFGCPKDGVFTMADLLRYVQSRTTGA